MKEPKVLRLNHWGRPKGFVRMATFWTPEQIEKVLAELKYPQRMVRRP